MARTLDKTVLLGAGLIVALLLGNAILAYRNTRQLLDDAGWVAHTYDVLDRAGELLRTLIDAESGQRGFIITGKESFLETYHEALRRLEGQIAALREMTSDNPSQQAHIGTLQSMATERLALLKLGIDLQPKQPEAARDLILTGKGKGKMDAIRGLVATIAAEERRLLHHREEQTASAYRHAVTMQITGTLTGLLLVGLLLYFMRQSLIERHNAAALLGEQRERLHTTLQSIGDAVIVTDSKGHITLMNPVARSLTGFGDDAVGQPLDEIFRIVNEQSRSAVESPVAKVIREGTIVGLANHTVLLAKDGRETPIDDSGAPIRNAMGELVGIVLVFRDISERRRLERLQRELHEELERQVQERTADLRASEERFRLLVDSAQDYAIFMLDPEGKVTTWNPGAARIKGYEAEEIIGQHFSRFYPAEAIDRGWPAHELRVAAERGRFEDEGWRVRKDGAQFWANVVITALRDETGTLRGFSKITRDLTERKRAEEQLRDANAALEKRVGERTAALAAERERLRVTLASIGDAVITTDTESRVTYLNPVAEKLTGWKSDEAHGQPLDTVFPILHEKTGQPVENPVAQVFRRGVIVGLGNHTVLTDRDGMTRPIDDSAAPIRGVKGETVGVVLTFRDVSEERHSQRQLQASEARARFLADASAALSALVDQESTLQTVARLAVPFFADWCSVELANPDGSLRQVAVAHVDPAKVELARDLNRRYPPDPQSPYGALAVIRTGESQIVQDIPDSLLQELVPDPALLQILRELGLKSFIAVPLSVRGTTLGAITFIGAESGRLYDQTDLAVAKDLAHRAGIAMENAQLYSDLRDADRRKDEFLAMLAHELRNPLAPIHNALHIMRQPGADAGLLQQVREMMERQVQHMTRMVDDLLDVSRITRGKIDLRKEIVDVAAAIARALESLRPLADDRQQKLAVSLPREAIRVRADPTRLEQILANLLNNAIKFTDHGGQISLSAELDDGELVVRVTDTGVGVPPDMLTRIFEPFVQSARVLHHSQGGLGIGLTLVRTLVEMHGGSVAAHSAGPGQGTEFIVRLPAVLPAESAESKSVDREDAARPVPKRSILVVDDNTDAAESLALLLRMEGHDVQVAHDGPAALAIVAASPPDVIFLDIGMPVMNGYEVAKQVRRSSGGKRLCLIAMTGWGQEEDRRRSQEAGFDDHLVKPTGLQAIRQVLAQLR